ncbi:MAG TPA: pitrilysin family protein [Jatrophihabitantaceae bacterium]|nr:pitrilysin family protein [Jatrophihabitantaceae bacterium]
MTSPVPALTRPRKPRKLTVVEETLPSGLRVVVVRKPGVPLVELRLRIPFQSARPTHPARAAVLSDAMLTGAGEFDRAGLAGAVQALGGNFSVGVDSDRLIVSGNALATNLRAMLELLNVVLTEATYPKADVAIERDRLVEHLSIARSRAGVIAGEALANRMWGRHPYALDLPQPDAVAAVTAGQLRTMHDQLVRPRDAVLIVVGDVSPSRALGQIADALQQWTGRAAAAKVPALPTPQPGPLLVVDRAGSVQSSIRLGGAAVPRSDDRSPALQLANLIFGGYFSSRWTENLREDKGYTYGPHSRIEHNVLGSSLLFDVEVATDVTAPALLETRYELGRIASLPVTEAEVDAVRQYAIGTLALSTATQAGLASTLSALSAFGLGLDWINNHPKRLTAAGVDEVSAAAAEFFAPARLVEVVVGDASTITAPLAALGPTTDE